MSWGSVSVMGVVGVGWVGGCVCVCGGGGGVIPPGAPTVLKAGPLFPALQTNTTPCLRVKISA